MYTLILHGTTYENPIKYRPISDYGEALDKFSKMCTKEGNFVAVATNNKNYVSLVDSVTMEILKQVKFESFERQSPATRKTKSKYFTAKL